MCSRSRWRSKPSWPNWACKTRESFRWAGGDDLRTRRPCLRDSHDQASHKPPANVFKAGGEQGAYRGHTRGLQGVKHLLGRRLRPISQPKAKYKPCDWAVQAGSSGGALVFSSYSHGVLFVFSWCSHGVLMVFSWCSHGVLLAFSRDVHWGAKVAPPRSWLVSTVWVYPLFQ